MKKKLLGALACTALLTLSIGAMPTMGATASNNMYRLYNPNNGEHFYTATVSEVNALIEAGWKYEGINWYAPLTSNTPVYRLYNPNAGEHFYTESAKERDSLEKAGWSYEGIGWYSDDNNEVPLYREYNPNAKTGTHNFTANKTENDKLVSNGWKQEGMAWSGLSDGSGAVNQATFVNKTPAASTPSTPATTTEQPAVQEYKPKDNEQYTYTQNPDGSWSSNTITFYPVN